VSVINSPPSVSRLPRQCEILNISQPYRPPRPFTKIAELPILCIHQHLAGTRCLHVRIFSARRSEKCQFVRHQTDSPSISVKFLADRAGNILLGAGACWACRQGACVQRGLAYQLEDRLQSQYRRPLLWNGVSNPPFLSHGRVAVM
jgi:hypothetical protein